MPPRANKCHGERNVLLRIVNSGAEAPAAADCAKVWVAMTPSNPPSTDLKAAREPRVLLVDDDRELCQMLTEYLNAEHFEVKSVHDGGDALTALQAGEFEILILDVMLPNVGGFDVLRKLGASHTTPILMLTARGDDVDRIVGLELGADDYLSKPFNPRELVARIRAILRRASNRAKAARRTSSPSAQSRCIPELTGCT